MLQCPYSDIFEKRNLEKNEFLILFLFKNEMCSSELIFSCLRICIAINNKFILQFKKIGYIGTLLSILRSSTTVTIKNFEIFLALKVLYENNFLVVRN